MESVNALIIERLNILIKTLVERNDRYKKSRKEMWIITVLPIALAIIIFCLSLDDLSKVGAIVASLIALVGTVIAYLDVYYRKEIDLTLNKISAIKAAITQLNTIPNMAATKEECFDKLEKVLL